MQPQRDKSLPDSYPVAREVDGERPEPHAIQRHPTTVVIDLDRSANDLRILEMEAGHRPLWSCIKASVHGRDANRVARHLLRLG